MKKKKMPSEFKADEEMKKYWGQRYRLFTKFDQGIKMDRGTHSSMSVLSLLGLLYIIMCLFFFSKTSKFIINSNSNQLFLNLK